MAAATAPVAILKINQTNGSEMSTPPPPTKSGRMGSVPQSTSIPPSIAPTAPTAPNTNGIPLSARKSASLDMQTVEQRKDHVPRPRKTSRPHGLLEAPTFYPSEDEFRAGPLEYIKKIEPEGRKYGIVKIVPPPGWKPPFAVDTERFHFRTRKQELNQTDGGTRANLNYLDQLAKFHKQKSGTTLNRFPSVDKRPLDLYKLKKFVEDKGGFENVCKGKRWAEIGRDLGYSGKIMSSLSTSLKNSYMKWLNPYEEWLKQNKPSVLQQQEREHGGPYTPSPAQTPQKPTIVSPVPMPNVAPAMQASMALSASVQNGAPMPHTAPYEPPPPPPRQLSGFTAVNAGGFTAVNAPQPPPPPPPQPSGFVAVNMPNGHVNGNVPLKPLAMAPLPMSLPNGVEVLNPTMNGMPNALKRSHSEEDTSALDDDESRRSKRLKKENNTPTITGSYMIQPRIPGPSPAITGPRDRSNDKPGDCEICGKGSDISKIMICDSCEVAYHTSCLDAPLKPQNDSDWHCPRCLVGTGEFGFEEGGIYSLKSFQEKALRFKERHFAKKGEQDPAATPRGNIPEEEVESEFWRLTETLTETVEVEYGADIHSTTHGSGFPTIEREPFSEYSTDPWNLNVMPLDKDSLFRHIKTDISGMTVPWLYVGMCFSTFCWHNEDHYTYSANYQHFGDTKTWYGIPSGSGQRFEDAMKEAVPELFEQQPDLLFQLVTLLQPHKLRRAQVEVYALDQRAGEFVITFPQAYHAGFNHGFNFNEAVNFAPAEWEPFGAAAIERLQVFRRQPVFSHEELLFSAAARDHSIKTARWLGTALKRVMEHELHIRNEFSMEYNQHRMQPIGENAMEVTVARLEPEDPPFVKDMKDLADEETVCAFCKAYCYLSRFYCKTNGKMLCLLHAGKFDCCSSPPADRLAMTDGNHELQHRMTPAEMETLVHKTLDTAKTPEVWLEKLDSILDEEERPSLRSLRSLVAEGERIDSSWPLTDLHDLKDFVHKCNAWVEEATVYITRKPNRRKGESRYRGADTKRKSMDDGKEHSVRDPKSIKQLLQAADNFNFTCVELEKLQERYDKITTYKGRARDALDTPQSTSEALEALIEEGNDLEMDLPEMQELEKKAKTVKWFAQAQVCSENTRHGNSISLEEAREFLERGQELEIVEDNRFMAFFKDQIKGGEFWESKAMQVMSVENVNFQQLDALYKQATTVAVSRATLQQIDEMLKKQREAEERVMNLYKSTKAPDYRERPKYKLVRETMENLQELNIKPPGTLDLEKELKRHEDWMRKGKKLFGKANAPLHILMAHMQYVYERNEHCLDLTDQPRMPVEPASREASPAPTSYADGSSSSSNVFCVCRKPESGMMIECELCHEWYHGKCFKIARGKVKEDDKYTCPICDYRVKIPRDAARPKLEDLQAWQDDLPNLPFLAEEEDILQRIVDTAQEFRNYLAGTIMANRTTPISTPDDLPVQRFYLRKIEGAEVLLVEETNFLRKELHRWAPVAPQPPEMISSSKSTRKPRPTKAERMAAMYQCDVDELPFEMQPRHVRKAMRQEAAAKGTFIDPMAWRKKMEGENSASPPNSAHQANDNIFTPPAQSAAGGGQPSGAASEPSNTSPTPPSQFQTPVPPTFSSIHQQAAGPGAQGANFENPTPDPNDPLSAFDPALMGAGPAGPSTPRHPQGSSTPLFTSNEPPPFRAVATPPSSALHPYPLHAPGHHRDPSPLGPQLPSPQLLHNPHHHPLGLDAHHASTVDPTLENMFAHPSGHVGPGVEDEAVEEMFGSLTNGGGDDQEFEFGVHRDEERLESGRY